MAPDLAGSPLPEALRRAAALVFVSDLESPVAGPDDAHHLRDVLRLRRGETIAASDGRGGWRLCVLDAAPSNRRGREPLGLEPTGPVEHRPLGGEEVAIGFALQKGDRPEWTVQKLTECGIDRIVPLLTERTVVRLDAADRRRRGERLRRVAVEAASQCRRTHLPLVADPLPLAEALNALPVPVAFAEPGGGSLGAARAVLVGPEGGWSPAELDEAPLRVDLGPLVLRAETAALVAGVLLGLVRRPLTGGAASG